MLSFFFLSFTASQVLAAELKDKLENARKVREAAKSGSGGTDFAHRRRNAKSKEDRADDESGEDDNMVVLSRTSKSGMVRPILGASDEWGSSGGRRKKRKNVGETCLLCIFIAVDGKVF